MLRSEIMYLLYFAIALLGISDPVAANWRACEKFAPSDFKYIPTKEELDSQCPSIIQYVNCYRDVIKDHPQDYDIHNRMRTFYVMDLFRDICTEGSKIRSDYLANRNCFFEMQNEAGSCLANATSTYEQHRSELVENNTRKDSPFSLKDCFIYGHLIGCLADNILQNCSSHARSTYLELVHRSKYLGGLCNPDNLRDLETKYLKYMELDKDIRDLLTSLFNNTL